MATIDPQIVRYGAYLFFAFVLWLIPTSANFPPLVSILCYLGAVVAFWYASVEGRGLGNSLVQVGRKERVRDALDQHELAARLHFGMEAITRQMEYEFAPPQVAALPPAQEIELDPQTQDYLDQLTELSKEVGWISATIVKQRKRSFKEFHPDMIREFFRELEELGIGATKGDGKSLEWTWHTDNLGN